MAVPALNITIDKGVDYNSTFTVTNPDGTPAVLTGYGGTAKIKKYPGDTVSYPFSVSITAATGRVSIAMTSGATALLDEGRHYYDVVVTAPSGIIRKVVEGMALVKPSVSV